jgi:predicted secreted hydrolase/threonine/homoserine/homoserine lactone efflux protein
MDYLTFLLRGFIIGISIAAPVGPIGVLCIRRTLANGRISGFISGLGAATADGLYGSLAALGLTFLIDLLVGGQTWLQSIGGLFLCYLGIKTFIERPAPNPISKQETKLNLDSNHPSGRSLLADYASTLLLTLTNPLTILSFAAIFAGLGLTAQAGSANQGLILVLGVFTGSATWWFVLSTLANVLRVRMLKPQGMRWINRISGVVIAGFGGLALFVSLMGFFDISRDGRLQSQVVTLSQPTDIQGYSRAINPRDLSFPTDHGPHPDFQTEWWYFTGNLETSDGRHFGYQLTFFRRSLEPPDLIATRPSDWATSQAYLAHFAITDVAAKTYQAFERIERGAARLAGAQGQPFQVWLDDWEIKTVAPDRYQIHAQQGEIALMLTLMDEKGPVLQGDSGLSQKGPAAGQASYYYSLTRLASSGQIQIGGREYHVDGLSWMDHEFSTSALAADQVGWDWFSIQMDDGSELMVYQMRKADGSIDPFSSGTLIAKDGSVISLRREDFEAQALGTWKSKSSGAVYPAGWLVKVPLVGLELRITPYLPDQELNLTYTYWEGCVRIEGQRNGQVLRGNGYVELTGYAGSMAGDF